MEGLASKLAEETGEIAGAVVKIPEGRTTAAELDQELGDALIVLAQFAARRHTTLESLLNHRFAQIKERAKRKPGYRVAQSCDACRFWLRQEAPGQPIGLCEAASKAHQVVAFAVNISSSPVYGYAGKECPCFVPKKEPVYKKKPDGCCGTCRFWQPAPTQVPGCGPEKVCGRSRMMGDVKGMSGQDGRSVITQAAFGCIHYELTT